METAFASGLRFRRIPRQSFSNCFQMDPLKWSWLTLEGQWHVYREVIFQDQTSMIHQMQRFRNSVILENLLCRHTNPVFDWDNERSMIFGQRITAANIFQRTSWLRIAVKVLSLSSQAGFVEPLYGTICLYYRERREKLSEYFIFHVLSAEMQNLEKPATEEGGVTSSVYSHKEPVHLTEREKQ